MVAETRFHWFRSWLFAALGEMSLSRQAGSGEPAFYNRLASGVQSYAKETDTLSCLLSDRRGFSMAQLKPTGSLY
jgi:hypothetical protein